MESINCVDTTVILHNINQKKLIEVAHSTKIEGIGSNCAARVKKAGIGTTETLLIKILPRRPE